MICDECGVNNATIKLMTITGGQKTERHLCAECMNKMRGKFGAMDLSSLAGILSGLLQQAVKQQSPDEAAATAGLACPSCGQTYEAFKQTGFLGCAQCYQAFREPLEIMLKRVHGHAQHCGRVPGGQAGGVSIKLNIDHLKQQLGRAIAEEEYEEAARLRDQIRSLKSQLEEAHVREGGAAHE